VNLWTSDKKWLRERVKPLWVPSVVCGYVWEKRARPRALFRVVRMVVLWGVITSAQKLFKLINIFFNHGYFPGEIRALLNIGHHLSIGVDGCRVVSFAHTASNIWVGHIQRLS